MLIVDEFQGCIQDVPYGKGGTAPVSCLMLLCAQVICQFARAHMMRAADAADVPGCGIMHLRGKHTIRDSYETQTHVAKCLHKFYHMTLVMSLSEPQLLTL